MSGSQYVWTLEQAAKVCKFPEDREDARLFLGGKGAGLVEMTQLGIPVPPAVVIGTDACKHYMKNPDDTLQALGPQVYEAMQWLEEKMQRAWGGVPPLLVSVRSGAPVSMPGMMDTILNVGMTSAGWPALVEMIGKTAADQCMSRLTDSFTKILGTVQVPEDPWQQLKHAVKAVFDSWNSPRAQHYRENFKISNGLGTAVVIQAMVFGNAEGNSGTGVCFTRHPSTGADVLYGEFLPHAQGEDIVSGERTPISLVEAAEDERFRRVITEDLMDAAVKLERHYRDMQDIEFTVECGNLWILQTRSGKRTVLAAAKIAYDMVHQGLITKEQAVERFDYMAAEKVLRKITDPSKYADRIIGRGLAVGGGVVSGIVVRSPDEAVKLAEQGKTPILLRPKTVPDDIHGMTAAAGIVTEEGGATSHAAVVARQLGKAAVVGVKLTVSPPLSSMITVDGDHGVVYAGEIESDESTMSEEMKALFSWREIKG